MESGAMVKLDQRREQSKAHWQEKTRAELYITVGMGTCGLAAGSAEALKALEVERRRHLGTMARRLRGHVLIEPMVEIQAAGRSRVRTATQPMHTEFSPHISTGITPAKCTVREVDETRYAGTGTLARLI
jgi:hypothetical protein